MSHVEARTSDVESVVDARAVGETSLREGDIDLVDLTTLEGPAPTVGATEPRSVPFVDLAGEYGLMRSEVDAAIRGVLERTDFVLGEAVEQFEEAFARFCGVDHAVGVDSGFSALELVLRAHDVGVGDEVITAANTFVATAAAVEACGATPVLVDIDRHTYNIDPLQIESAVSERTRAIIPVHLYGRPAAMGEIMAIAEANGLWVFEDACQAHGARYRGRRVGSLGHAAAFSFYPSKNLGAYGDGGIVVTDDSEVAERVRRLRNLGSTVKHHHEVKGFNRRLDTLQAAVLAVKLDRLDEWNRSRRRTALLYERLLEDLPITTPSLAEDAESVYHLYVIETGERTELQEHLERGGVATGIHYPVPIHLQPAYTELGAGALTYPVSESSAERILSLPMYPNMDVGDVSYVAHLVRSFYGA